MNKSKEKTPGGELPQLSAIEQEALSRWYARHEKRITPPKWKEIEKDVITYAEENPNMFFAQMLETTGSTDPDFNERLICQVASTLQSNRNESDSNFASSLMHGIHPKDETEGILIAQMVGTHNLIMDSMRRAAIPKQHLEAGNDYINRAAKLMNIYLRQMELLLKYRGNAHQQKMIVEHVHIHQGGQAVVGQIENKPRGEGDGKK